MTDKEIVAEMPKNSPIGENVEVTKETGADFYIKNLKEIKSKTVPAEEYDKVVADNKKLVESLKNGFYEKPVEVIDVIDKDKLRKELYGGDSDLNNLEYVQKTLQLRDQLIREGKPDPFLPFGHNINPTQADYECAERVARVFQECIDAADGDSNLFTNELMRRTNDVRIR